VTLWFFTFSLIFHKTIFSNILLASWDFYILSTQIPTKKIPTIFHQITQKFYFLRHVPQGWPGTQRSYSPQLTSYGITGVCHGTWLRKFSNDEVNLLFCRNQILQRKRGGSRSGNQPASPRVPKGPTLRKLNMSLSSETTVTMQRQLPHPNYFPPCKKRLLHRLNAAQHHSPTVGWRFWPVLFLMSLLTSNVWCMVECEECHAIVQYQLGVPQFNLLSQLAETPTSSVFHSTALSPLQAAGQTCTSSAWSPLLVLKLMRGDTLSDLISVNSDIAWTGIMINRRSHCQEIWGNL
jgi:hypothetical protein